MRRGYRPIMLEPYQGVSRRIKNCGVSMAVKINGRTYYRTSEVCAKTGISRATLFRWLKLGVIGESLKDRRGWRLFSTEDVNAIRTEATKVGGEKISGEGASG